LGRPGGLRRSLRVHPIQYLLVGSGIAIVASAVVVTLRARAYRARRELSEAEDTE
jgi:hypothetical protein